MSEQVDDLIDYSSDEEEKTVVKAVVEKEAKKGSYVGIHATGFRDFLLKPELLNAIGECGFEHPSEGICILNSSTRVYPSSHSGYGCALPSKIWNGKDCRVCFGMSAAVGNYPWNLSRSSRRCVVSHS